MFINSLAAAGDASADATRTTSSAGKKLNSNFSIYFFISNLQYFLIKLIKRNIIF